MGGDIPLDVIANDHNRALCRRFQDAASVVRKRYCERPVASHNVSKRCPNVQVVSRTSQATTNDKNSKHAIKDPRALHRRPTYNLIRNNPNSQRVPSLRKRTRSIPKRPRLPTHLDKPKPLNRLMRDFNPPSPLLQSPNRLRASWEAQRRRSIQRQLKSHGETRCEDGQFDVNELDGCIWYRGCGDIRNALVVYGDLARTFDRVGRWYRR
ncbi:hypothetical protein BJ322DRAFT_532207 [Thelephora terrestris]|uniref:Uncharacterized protein n=1 Tax=Thelephora terrestris TaxID=56493 RepID=A0A9P6LAJ2_9AGAM|nr:hypothetical protein BJ322DRAFT_532207 [Thelephora terrestris]